MIFRSYSLGLVEGKRKEGGGEWEEKGREEGREVKLTRGREGGGETRLIKRKGVKEQGGSDRYVEGRRERGERGE